MAFHTMGTEYTTTVEEKIEETLRVNTEDNNGILSSINGVDEIPPDDEAFFASGRLPQGVRYRVEYRSTISDKVVHSIHADSLYFTIDARSELFDIVTTFLTADMGFQDEKGRDARRAPRVTDTRRRVEMHIHSQAIIHALRSVVKYYPGQDLLGETIIIPAPYAVLVHHYEELNEFKERCHPSRLIDPICPKEKDAYNDIKIMQDFLEQTIMPSVRIEQERNKRGFETFDMIWLRVRPGATFKWMEGGLGLWDGIVIESVEDGTMGFGGKPWSIQFWKLDYNGTWVGTCKSSFTTQRFEGEREIKWVQRIEDSAFQEPLNDSVKDLVKQGEKFYSLLTKKCQYYKGTTFDFPHNQIDGLVMVDMKKYYSDEDTKSDRIRAKPFVSLHPSEKSWVTDCICSLCQRRKQEKVLASDDLGAFVDYHGLYPEDKETLTPHQYFLLPPKMWAFVFKTRSWEDLHVSSFVEPKFQEDMIDKLVMDPGRIKTLKALAGSYIRKNRYGVKSHRPPWSADFIQGKGQGQIILLHGKPGVGKTCTAECIAEYTKRPLMVLTSSDIGADPEKIEKILRDGFKTASSWGAVLLIDEADVFMERRSSNDLNRNCLVAGFLRALEFYDGILFLTTNRVGSFDDAFVSRIHVQLYYPDFTDEERQRVWQTFIDKLIEDRGSSIRVSIDAKDFIKGREMREIKWNGREIRNAFQTAVALAEYDAVTDEEGKILLKDTHLSSMVDMSRDFKKYLDETHHGADEDKRAAMEQIRHDDRVGR